MTKIVFYVQEFRNKTFKKDGHIFRRQYFENPVSIDLHGQDFNSKVIKMTTTSSIIKSLLSVTGLVFVVFRVKYLSILK